MTEQNITIRTEQLTDYASVFLLTKVAFKNEDYSDHQEHFLVERLRKSDAFIPELSLVAVTDNQIIGHILLTKIRVVNGNNSAVSLALAPVSVLPEFQKRRVGEKLILAAHAEAKRLGYGSVILLGHEDYYPRFGYTMLKNFGITLPFDVPDKNCMAIELTQGALDNVTGVVEYPEAFN